VPQEGTVLGEGLLIAGRCPPRKAPEASRAARARVWCTTSAQTPDRTVAAAVPRHIGGEDTPTAGAQIMMGQHDVLAWCRGTTRSKASCASAAAALRARCQAAPHA
jgi:hypothetical protein